MSNRNGERPHGRAEVMAAVRSATAELLAERGPRDISVRDVAERANVNHALVHRHFGTKDDLFRAVISELSAEIAAAISRQDVATALRQLQAQPAYWRIMARAVLDAPQVLEPGRTSAASAVLAMLGGADEVDDPTRTAAAAAGCLVLGWIVFGAHLSTVLAVADDELLEAAVADAVGRLLAQRVG